MFTLLECLGTPERRISSPSTFSTAESYAVEKKANKEETKKLRRGLNSLTQLAAMYEQYEKEESNEFEFEPKITKNDKTVLAHLEEETSRPSLKYDAQLDCINESDKHVVPDKNYDEKVFKSSKESVEENKTESPQVPEVKSELDDVIEIQKELDHQLPTSELKVPTPELRRRKSSLYKVPSLVVAPLPKINSTAENEKHSLTPEKLPKRRKSFLATYKNHSLQDVSNVIEKSNQASSLKDLRKTPTKRISAPKAAVKTLFNKLAQPKKKQEKLPSSSNTTRRSSNTKPPLRAQLSIPKITQSKDFGTDEATSSAIQQCSKTNTQAGKKKGVSPTPSTSTSRSVSPVRPRSPQKGSTSPSRPASRSTGLVSPSTTTKPKTSTLKSGDSQQNISKIKTRKSSGLPAPTGVGIEPKFKIQPTKPTTSKTPKPLSSPDKNKKIKPPSSLKQTKKLNTSATTETKPKNLAETKRPSNSESTKNQNTNSNKTVSDMKETNLNDEKTDNETVRNQQTENHSTVNSSSRNAVQMNRAARLRLLKKTQSPVSKDGN